MRSGLMVLSVSLVMTSGIHSQDCKHSVTVINNDFAFVASTDQGAVGDVAAVELSLGIENIHGGIVYYEMNVAYDDSVVELVGNPQYSEIHERFIFYELNNKIPDDYRLPGISGKALNFSGLFNSHSADEYFAAGNVLPIATVYFRLIGVAGETTQIRFSDGEFVWPGRTIPCIDNSIGFRKTEVDPDGDVKVRSTQNISGEIRIFAGEATHTEVPSSPPLATVYQESPTPESANIHFELTGGNVRPGATDVPVNIYITSNYEFSGYQAAGTFPSQYLTLRKIEEHTRPGVQHIDNLNGEFWIISKLSRWRIGLENERVLVATLYFDVNQNAVDGAILPLELKDWGPVDRVYTNWIGLNNEGASNPKIPIVTEVEPLVITQSALNIRSTAVTILGDAKGSGQNN